MNINTFSLPSNPHNIKSVKKYAAEKDYLLKERNENVFDLIDKQTGETVCTARSLFEIHDFLTESDD